MSDVQRLGQASFEGKPKGRSSCVLADTYTLFEHRREKPLEEVLGRKKKPLYLQLYRHDELLPFDTTANSIQLVIQRFIPGSCLPDLGSSKGVT